MLHNSADRVITSTNIEKGFSSCGVPAAIAALLSFAAFPDDAFHRGPLGVTPVTSYACSACLSLD